MKLVTKDFTSNFTARREQLSRFEVYEGVGSPEGVQTGSPGDLYINRNGGSDTTLFKKESGHGTNTGWVGTGGNSGWVGQQIFIATQDQTDFTLTEFTIDANSKITVETNGLDEDEGGSYEWVRNTSLNKIVFNQGKQIDARVKIKLWN